MFPTSTLVPSKDLAGVRFSTSPAGHKPCSVESSEPPRASRETWSQELLLGLNSLHYLPAAFWVMLSIFPSGFPGINPQMMTPKPHLKQGLVPPNFLRLRRAVTKVMSQSHPGEPSCWKMLCKQRLSLCPLNSRLLALDKAPGFPALPPATQTPRNPGFPPVPPAT